MNINEQLRRAHNVIKYSQKEWEGKLGEPEAEFFAPYFLGALAASEILIHIWRGNILDSELEKAIIKLKNPLEREVHG